MSAPDVGLMVHEFNHRYLDNLTALEGIQLTMFHGLANLGYGGSDVGYPHLLNTYRSVYLYLIRRDMWRRFTDHRAEPHAAGAVRGQGLRLGGRSGRLLVPTSAAWQRRTGPADRYRVVRDGRAASQDLPAVPRRRSRPRPGAVALYHGRPARRTRR